MAGGSRRGPEEILVRLSLVVTAAQAKYTYGGSEVFRFLFHGGPRPSTMAEDALYRVYRLDVPITLHRNGWVFDHAELVPVQEQLVQLPVTKNGLIQTAELKANVGGRVLTVSLNSTTRATTVFGNRRPGDVAFQDAYDWNITLPPFIDDVGVGDVTISGSESHQMGAGTQPWERPFVWWPWRGSSESTGRFTDGVGVVTATGCAWNAQAPQFDAAHGAAEQRARWWINDPRPAGVAPGQGQPPHILRYYARAPKPLADPLTQVYGAQPIVAEQVGPWLVRGYYKRRSEAGPAASAPAERAAPSERVSNEDPFWDWFAGFSEKAEQARGEVETERTTVVLLGMLAQNLRRSNRILLESDMSVADGDWLADLVGEEPSTLTGDAAFARRITLVREQADELRDTLQRMDAATGRAAGQLDGLLTDLDKACDSHSDRHPEVLLYRRSYRELAQRLRLEFAIASGDYDAFKVAVEQLRTAGASAQLRVWEARLLLQRGDSIEALFAARDGLMVEPGNREARALVAELEASLIGSSLRKAHGAIAEARAAFYKYLKERGFSSDDPKNAWLGQIWSPLRHIDSEMAWSAFTSGISNVVAAWYTGVDRPTEEQRGLSAYEASMTRAYLGLQIILRLAMRGYTVAEISRMTSADLQETLPLTHATGDAYTPHEVAGLGAMVQDAIRNLPDVRALASDDRNNLKAAVAKGYWDPRDVGNTWAEWIGDITSPKNLLLILAPFSVGTVGGRVATVQFWGWRLSAAEKSIMAGEGITSGTEVISALVGWDRAMKALAGTRQGQRLVALLARMQKFERGLGSLPPQATRADELFALGTQASWYGGKFVATMVVMSMGGMAAEHAAQRVAGDRGGEVARFVVEALLMLAQDHELMSKLLRSGAIDGKKMGRLIHESYVPYCREAQQRIERSLALKAELKAIVAARKDAKTLTSAQTELLRKAREEGLVPAATPGELIPTGDAVADARAPLKRALDESLGADTLGGEAPARALERMEPRVRAKQNEMRERADRAQRLGDELDSADTLTSLPLTMPGAQPAERATLPGWVAWNSKHPTPFSYKSNIPKVLEADQALLDGEVDRAIRLSEEAQSGITFGNPETAALEQRLGFAESVLQTPRPPAGSAARELAELTDDEVERVFARENAWKNTPPCARGTASVLYCDGDLMIKEMEVGPSPAGTITPRFSSGWSRPNKFGRRRARPRPRRRQRAGPADTRTRRHDCAGAVRVPAHGREVVRGRGSRTAVPVPRGLRRHGCPRQPVERLRPACRQLSAGERAPGRHRLWPGRPPRRACSAIRNPRYRSGPGHHRARVPRRVLRPRPLVHARSQQHDEHAQAGQRSRHRRPFRRRTCARHE